MGPQGRVASWRYRVSTESIYFIDGVMGACEQELSTEVGDFVIRRADNLFAYQLAVMVDDAAMGITDVVRGSDLLDSTARQITLFRSFGLDEPRFHHVPLMLDDDGNRMAKRDGSKSLQQLKDEGFSAPQVIGQLAASLQLVPPGSSCTPQELVDALTLQQFEQALVLAQN